MADDRALVSPDPYIMRSWERLPLAGNFASRLTGSEVVSGAEAVVIEADTGNEFLEGLDGEIATVDGSGQLVTQWVANLESQKDYELEWRATIGVGASARREAAYLKIHVSR